MTQPGNKTVQLTVLFGGLILIGALFYFSKSSSSIAAEPAAPAASSPESTTIEPTTVTAASTSTEIDAGTVPGADAALSEEPSTKASPETIAKVQTLREILNGHGDNDPRMDKELLHLDAATKRAFRAEYQHTALERRNARGTIVFLLARNLNSPEDFAFMKTVLAEPPCLSMQDCRGTANDPIGEGAAEHDEGAVTEKVLSYPQAMAVESIARELQNRAFTAEQKKNVIPVLEQGTSSRVPFIARRSRELLNSLSDTP